MKGIHFNITKFGKNGKLKKLKYFRISAGPQRGKYVHRLLMEAKLGRKLTLNETVHHIDGNEKNIDIDNLEVKTWTEHGWITRKMNAK